MIRRIAALISVIVLSGCAQGDKRHCGYMVINESNGKEYSVLELDASHLNFISFDYEGRRIHLSSYSHTQNKCDKTGDNK